MLLLQGKIIEGSPEENIAFIFGILALIGLFLFFIFVVTRLKK